MSVVLGGIPAAALAACPTPVPESEWSLIMPLAARTLMLDIASVGDTLVVVGDRGHVLISEDQGRSWIQQRAPTRMLLTGVWFQDRNLGWAVGHDAVILRTEDGGETWCLVHAAPELERPLFDVWFEDAQHGFAVGAYGYVLRSSDGGLSWREESLALVDAVAPDADADDADDADADDAEDGNDAGDVEAEDAWDDDWLDDESIAADLHLNKIVPGTGGRLYIAAEAGTVFRSADRGRTWVALAPPYDGSFFGGLPPDDRSLLVFGLRGNMFRSWDAGETWRQVDLPVDTSLFGGARLDDGGIVVVGTAGVMLISREGDRFRLVQRGDRKALVSAMLAGDGALIVIGEPGIERLEPGALAAD
ncbi:MAG TPA: YCF48-related protein [Gammaproteobacteria bacterium]|nr:YCF48-related protein [Gammaproteobacteria bacterium]